MSYPPDPNNPYGQPPQPGYGYPQQAPPAAGYGYPQAAPVYGYAPAVPQTMPGLVVTTRVLLFIIGAVQIIGAGVILIASAVTKTVTKQAHDSYESDPFGGFGNAATSVLVVVGIVALLFAVFSITLGVKFGQGGPAVRITALVYGSLGALWGLLMFLGSFANNVNPAPGLVFALMWLAVSIVMIVGMSTRDGVAWFARPRY
ncbi:hypothetical protein F7Q99_09980 [Streptomyces kaniharaensis]|uniref:Uncharacterized protein n=1 Tax=Streptomyces kaniharaensis TaxID=212423 RepID=A0A6N7KM85_9ACTN|nr:hypothetical protein [Streptomyces kaniharaensis]MQS12606.1 hypothetical protein [Streptomyces kaniharaensis]